MALSSQSVSEEYKCEKSSVQSEEVDTDKFVTLLSILCAVVSHNINHDGRPILINSPVDYPADELRGANITLDGRMNNDGHSYRLFGVINYKSTGSDTSHYTIICKSKDSRDWFEYNDGDLRKSEFCKHNGGPEKAPYQRLVTILFYDKTGISDSNDVLSKQAQPGMQSTTTSVGHLPNAMLIDGKNVTLLKDDESISTLSTRDCSHDGAPSAAFNDGWTTFEEWNYNERPSYQISVDLFNKMTCNICIKEVFIRFTSKGELSGCKHDFCYRCIWKWENTTIIEGNCFQCLICRMVCTPIDQIKEIKSTNIPKNIYLTSKVEYLDSNKDDITGDYWHCNICGRYYAKLDSTKHEFIRVTGMTYCCKQVACYVCLDKALKNNNNRCPLCKEVCDPVKFSEHHPDIVIQKD
jgi:hypothetical protein